jgi:2-methylisocitrate lyase-like PEP mutase family enzyme
MTTGAACAAALRLRLAHGPLLVAPGVSDPYTARIIEQLGFEALYLGGNALGLQLGVGQPFVTLTETADAVHRINRGAGVPLIADAGAGFGDAAHAALAMNLLSHAGAAAIHLDDQCYPKRAHYHCGVGRLSEPEVVAGKLNAMRQVRPDGPLLIARTDALRVTGSLDAAIERCSRYAEAGAEAVMVLDLGVDGAARIAKALPGVALVWIGGIAEPVPTAAELEAAGFAMALYPFNTIGAITDAVTATWREMATTGRPAMPARPSAQTAAEALALVGMDTYWRIERATTEPDPSSSTVRILK